MFIYFVNIYTVKEFTGDIMKFLKIFVLCIFLIGMLASLSMAAEDKDGSDTNEDYQKKMDDENKAKDDEDTAKKIYSDDYILGFERGDQNILEEVNPDESMKVISSSPIVTAIMVLVFLIGLGLCIIGYFGATIWNTLKMIYATIFKENSEESMDVVQSSRKSNRRLTMGIGETFILASIVYFLLFNQW